MAPLALSALGVLFALSAMPLLAGSCATQGVPAATLLVPYFLVSRSGTQGEDIPEGGADTLLSITNTGPLSLIVQATVWNKYGRPVLSWNIPFRGHDTASFRMKDVLNGKLNVNPNAQRGIDPCLRPSGFGQAWFTRFPNPDPEDASLARSIYPVPAFAGVIRRRLWDSLDESGDVMSLTSPGGRNILDFDNPACGIDSDGLLEGDLAGSMTFDVMNTCTARYPDEPARYANGSLATTGWELDGRTPNVLIGDVFLLERGPYGQMSGDLMVSLPFDPVLTTSSGPTFYGRYSRGAPASDFAGPVAYLFDGDGRMPLGSGYVFRFQSDEARDLRSQLIVWRSGFTTAPDRTRQPDLCAWWRSCIAGEACNGYGHFVADQRLATRLSYDNDGNVFVGEGPVGGAIELWLYTFLQAQRIDLYIPDYNIAGFRAGYLSLELPGDPLTNQAFVAVQHSGPGLSLSVGHAATVTRSPVSCGGSPPWVERR